MVRASGRECLVETADGEYRCQIRGRLTEAVRTTTAPVVTGDLVELVETEPGRGVIESVAPRRTTVSRVATGARPYQQVVAANIDRFFIVASARQPALNPGFIDRAVVVALSGAVEPVVCVNKIDLDPEAAYGEVAELYRQLGYQVMLTSAATGEGMDALREQFRGRLSALVGQSGVGKSSILNHLEPGLQLATRDLMARHDRGRHTTAATRLYALGIGGYVADTPGIKQLRPWGLSRDQLVECFVEMAPLAGSCKFRDCTHLHEPGCAIREAVEAGRIHPRRYDGYCRLAEGIEDSGE